MKSPHLFRAYIDFYTLLIMYCYQWWSLEIWSRSRDSSRDTILRVSVSKVSVSVSEFLMKSRSRSFN